MFGVPYAFQSLPSSIAPSSDAHTGFSLQHKIPSHFSDPQIHSAHWYVRRRRFVTSLWTRGDQDISFLKINQVQLPSNTERIIQCVIQAYIESDIRDTKGDVNIEEVLDAIDLEYKWSSVPFSVAGTLFDFHRKQSNSTNTVAWQVFSKVISFAVMNHLPKDMAMILFEGINESSRLSSDTKDELQRLVVMLRHCTSWNCIEFPQGLSLRLKRSYLVSKREKFYPLPRKSFFTSRMDELDAKRVIEKAESIKLPIKLAKKEDVEEFAKDLNTKSVFASDLSLLSKDPLLTFFPKQNQIRVKLRRLLFNKKVRQVKDLSVAGIVTYGVISMFWYIVAIRCRWMQLAEGTRIHLVGGEMQDLKRFGKISLLEMMVHFFQVMKPSKRTVLPRLSVSIFMTLWTKKLWKRMENHRLQGWKDHGDKLVAMFVAARLCLGVLGDRKSVV